MKGFIETWKNWFVDNSDRVDDSLRAEIAVDDLDVVVKFFTGQNYPETGSRFAKSVSLSEENTSIFLGITNIEYGCEATQNLLDKNVLNNKDGKTFNSPSLNVYQVFLNLSNSPIFRQVHWNGSIFGSFTDLDKNVYRILVGQTKRFDPEPAE